MKITKENLLTALLCVVAVAFVAYNEYDDYRWAKEYQAQCDAVGC